MLDVIQFREVNIGQEFGITYTEVISDDIYHNTFIKLTHKTVKSIDEGEVFKMLDMYSTCWVYKDQDESQDNDSDDNSPIEITGLTDVARCSYV